MVFSMVRKEKGQWSDWEELDPEDVEDLVEWFDLSEVDR